MGYEYHKRGTFLPNYWYCPRGGNIVILHPEINKKVKGQKPEGNKVGKNKV